MLLTTLFAKIFKKNFPLTVTRTLISKKQPLITNFFEKTKKDRDRRQSTDDLSSALPDSHGHPVFHRLFPDYFRWLFPTVKNLSVI